MMISESGYEYPHVQMVEQETTPIPKWTIPDIIREVLAIRTMMNHSNCKREELAIQTDALMDKLYSLKENTGKFSDGYHTFDELYHHRALLFSALCHTYLDRAWKSKKHHDGTMYENMFIVGLDTPEGQATYHYNIDPYWDLFRVKEVEFAPKWDGHMPEDAIERIKNLPIILEKERIQRGMQLISHNTIYGVSGKFPQSEPQFDAEYQHIIAEIDEVVKHTQKIMRVAGSSNEIWLSTRPELEELGLHGFVAKLAGHRHARVGEIVVSDYLLQATYMVLDSHFEQRYIDAFGSDSLKLLTIGTGYVDAINLYTHQIARLQYDEYSILQNDSDLRPVFYKLFHDEIVQAYKKAKGEPSSDE